MQLSKNARQHFNKDLTFNLNFLVMSKNSLLHQYKKDVTELTKRAKHLNLSNHNIKKIFDECFKEIEDNDKKQRSYHSIFSLILKITLLIVIFCLILYVLLNVHQPTSSIVLRNVQGLIYPGLKLVRFLAVPILKQFPSLTHLYDESCLVENPYFYVSDMECWPCEDVHTIVDLTDFDNYSLYQSGIPYVVKTNQKPVSFYELKFLYSKKKEILDNNADRIRSTNSRIKSLDSLFNQELEVLGHTHISWRINRMLPAQIIRSLFPRPYIVPERSGQSVERFIMIDEVNAEGYSFPNTECSYVFVIQSSGERTIILKPSKECGNACRTVSIILKPSFVLWYNWWYWRPMSFPSQNASKVSITYISSYC